MLYQGTNIDGPQMNPDKLILRGIDLNELIGKKTLLECMFLALYNQYPTVRQLQELNRFYDDAFRSIDSNDILFKIIPEIATTSDYSLNATIAGLAIDRKKEINALRPPDFEDIKISETVLSGFYFMAILPIICGLSAIYPIEKDISALKKRLEKAKNFEGDYIERIALFFRDKALKNEKEKRLLESVLVSFCAGFGYMTPSIMTPRISIGSGVTVGISIIAGCTTAGPWHLGTSQDVIMMFQKMNKDRNGQDMKMYVTSFLEEQFADGNKLLGFGHPFFKRDPRVTRLLEVVDETELEHESLNFFKTVSEHVVAIKNIHPNLEAMHGAIMTSLDFNIPFFGPSIALIGRTVTMIAHMDERQSKPAFGIKNKVARNYLNKVPMDWL